MSSSSYICNLDFTSFFSSSIKRFIAVPKTTKVPKVQCIEISRHCIHLSVDVSCHWSLDYKHGFLLVRRNQLTPQTWGKPDQLSYYPSAQRAWPDRDWKPNHAGYYHSTKYQILESGYKWSEAHHHQLTILTTVTTTTTRCRPGPSSSASPSPASAWPAPARSRPLRPRRPLPSSTAGVSAPPSHSEMPR